MASATSRDASSATTIDGDRRHMAAALDLARRGLGRTWPNPSVGCVLVRDGRVVGRGATASGGRPHAETQAIGMAGALAGGATAYVTLEPCAHHGVTPPCADALVAAGIARAVVALADPDPRTAGQGIARMRAAGIAVDVGLAEAEAAELNAGFLSRIARGRPMVTLKVAASLDGRVASASGDSKWITGDAARRRGHMLRACHDAIVIGSGTALADNPRLTCRLPGLEGRSPLRIVIDSGLRLTTTSELFHAISEAPLWVVCGAGADPEQARRLTAAGAEVIEVRRDDAGRVEPLALLASLGERGLTRVLVEGGPTLATSLLKDGLVDRVAWFTAPLLLGEDARGAIGPLALRKVADGFSLGPSGLVELAPDVLQRFVMAAGREGN